eukprot:874919-Rhodomonas_salina.2
MTLRVLTALTLCVRLHSDCLPRRCWSGQNLRSWPHPHFWQHRRFVPPPTTPQTKPLEGTEPLCWLNLLCCSTRSTRTLRTLFNLVVFPLRNNADASTGMTLAPGLYKSPEGMSITGSALTLDAGGDPDKIFIFQMATEFSMGEGMQIVLAGGAKASNIFWQVGTSAVLATTSVFKGILIANQAITLKTGASVVGRLYAVNAAVNLDSNAITTPV